VKKTIFAGLFFVFSTLSQVQAEIPKISNLQFSANPAVIGEWFTITIEFEGDIDKLVLENTSETQTGGIN
jgi:hypothetical protein